MNFVASGTEFSRLLPHERLEKHAAMRFGIQLYHKIVQKTSQGIRSGSHFVELGIFEIKISLPHGAFPRGNGVAHHATKTSLRFRTMHNLFDGSVHQPAVQNRRVMASTAPFRRPRAHRVLHIFNTFAIPLIIERRKVMGRTEPLIVDVFVATLARLRFHEKLAGNLLAAKDLGGTGEEWPAWP